MKTAQTSMVKNKFVIPTMYVYFSLHEVRIPNEPKTNGRTLEELSTYPGSF